jgi:hypothetical protein
MVVWTEVKVPQLVNESARRIIGVARSNQGLMKFMGLRLSRHMENKNVA